MRPRAAQPGGGNAEDIDMAPEKSAAGRRHRILAVATPVNGAHPADIGGTGLAAHLALQISAGTGDSGDCSDFVADTTVYKPTGLTDTTRTATAFSAASSSYATGADGWAANPAAQRTYRISWQSQDDNAARNRVGSLTFTWEAQDL